MIFVAIPIFFLELFLSLKVGENIGFVWSTLWIVFTIIIGVNLLRSSPLALMGNLSSVSQGKLSMKSFQNASTAYLLGAMMLIVPGVLTDFLGLLLLSYTVYLQFVAKITPEQTKFNTKKGDDDVIDVEIIDEHTDTLSNP